MSWLTGSAEKGRRSLCRFGIVSTRRSASRSGSPASVSRTLARSRRSRPELRSTSHRQPAAARATSRWCSAAPQPILISRCCGSVTGKSRASFYFYFQSKHDVLGELLRRAVDIGHQAAALTEIWTDLMTGYTTATTEKIRADQRVGLVAHDIDAYHLAASLTWLGERVYYLASIQIPPFDDQPTLVDSLTSIWMSTVYRPAG